MFGVALDVGILDSVLFLLRCYLSAPFTLESKEVCPSSTRAPEQTLSPVLGRPRSGARTVWGAF